MPIGKEQAVSVAFRLSHAGFVAWHAIAVIFLSFLKLTTYMHVSRRTIERNNIHRRCLTSPSVGPTVSLVIACISTIAMDHTSMDGSRITALSIIKHITSGAA